jgi:hypothetical protein
MVELPGLQILSVLYLKNMLDIPNDGDLADTDGEWTFIDNMDGTGRITHQRADNSRYYWEYDSGTQEDDDADTAQIGSLGPRVKVGEEAA